jgi:hypothetical protein
MNSYFMCKLTQAEQWGMRKYKHAERSWGNIFFFFSNYDVGTLDDYFILAATT